MDEKIKGSLLKDHIYEKISDMIVNAELMPGDRITEISIAEKFGVSLTPVREALIKLHADGILHKVPHKGFYVNKYSEQEIVEIYEVFCSLQELAIQISMDKFTEEDIRRQEELIDEMEHCCERQDFKSYLAANHRVHDYYVNRSENQFLISMYHNICIRPVPIFYFSEEEREVSSMKKGIHEHRCLVDCFRRKDMAEVRRILASHYGLGAYMER